MVFFICIFAPTSHIFVTYSENMEFITIDNDSSIPKYKQLIHCIQEAISNGTLKLGDQMPSLSFVKSEYNLSRDTVLKAFNELKNKRILSSTPGKGYYVETTNIHLQEKIFVMFDEFSGFKEVLYNSFLTAIGRKASVDIFFHHFNREVYRSLLAANIYNYTSFVIMPATFKNITSSLKALPTDKTYILDRKLSTHAASYGTIYQNFAKGLRNALEEGYHLLKKYNRLILISATGKEPEERKIAFSNFCTEKKFQFEVLEDLENREPRNGEVYLITHDSDMVKLIKEANQKGLTLGKHLGIISFNDTPLKEVVADGITTISTNFERMGQSLAKMILNGSKEIIENPTELIIRNSL